MKTTREEHEAALAAESNARKERAHSSLVCRHIEAVPNALVTPGLIADVLDSIIKKVEHLSTEARETALGYLTDCRDDMRHYAEQT